MSALRGNPISNHQPVLFNGATAPVDGACLKYDTAAGLVLGAVQVAIQATADGLVAGIHDASKSLAVQGSSPDGQPLTLITDGVCNVLVSGTVAAGDELVADGSADGSACTLTTEENAFAVALEGGTDTLVLARLCIRPAAHVGY